MTIMQSSTVSLIQETSERRVQLSLPLKDCAAVAKAEMLKNTKISGMAKVNSSKIPF